MAQSQHTTPSLAHLEEALTVLFCLIDDAYAILNSHGARRYESIKRLSDSEFIALALFQQLRGVQSEPSFLRDIERFFSHLSPGGVGLHPFSFHTRRQPITARDAHRCWTRAALNFVERRLDELP
jgi:hypothetical protein